MSDIAPYPECMAPDGAEPCPQYADLLAKVDELERVLGGVLPMAKGYAARNKVGRNQEKIFEAEAALEEQP